MHALDFGALQNARISDGMVDSPVSSCRGKQTAGDSVEKNDHVYRVNTRKDGSIIADGDTMG